MRQTQPRKKRESLEEVSRAALQALSQLVPRLPSGNAFPPPLKTLLDRMYQSVLEPDPKALDTLIDAMLRAKISRAEIVELYVPDVARRLGDSWLDDSLAFGAVTIGTVRLQAAVRRIDRDLQVSMGPVALGRETFLVGVGQGEQHTLGACVLATMLRQRGYYADLELDLTPALMAEKVKSSVFAGILLCSSDIHRLEILRKLVINVRHHSRGTPVIIGGSVLENSQDVLSFTQADLVTSDLATALRFCKASAAARKGVAASNMASEPSGAVSLGGTAG